MKVFSKYTILLVSGWLLVTGCTDKVPLGENYQPSLTPRYLNVQPQSFNRYTADEGQENLFVESLETPWKFTDNPSWTILDPVSGNSDKDVVLTILENSSASQRTAIFYLKADVTDWDYQQPIDVTQPATTPYAEPLVGSLEFSGEKGSGTVTVKSNCDWETDSSQSWISANKNDDGNSITVFVEENPNKNYRSGYLYLVYEGKTLSWLEIIQNPADISVTDLSLEFENSASAYSLTVTSQSSWTTKVSDSWIQCSPEEGGAGEVTLTIEVSQNSSVNERKGYVAIFTGTNERLQIKVTQKGLYLEGESVLSFTSRQSSLETVLNSNIPWSVKSSPEWVSLSPSSGEGKATITVSVEENPSVNSRNGEIVYISPGLDISFTTSIIQAGKSLTPGSTIMQFSDKAGTQELPLTADGVWTAEVSEPWISISPSSGSGDALISVSVMENTAENKRSGNIIFHFGERNITVAVEQQGKYFDVDASSFTFTSSGGSHIIELKANQQWNVAIEESEAQNWLSVSSDTKGDSQVITVVAAPNPTLSDRTATIIITPQYSQAIRINVVQKGMYLTVSVNNISFFARGGESDIITINTDGTYTLTTPTPWLTINEKSENTFTVTAGENDSSDTREGSVTVTLQGLSSGSYSVTIPVVQVGKGGSFILEGYPEDADWDEASNGNITITVSGYTTDQNWNTDSHSSLTITIDGFEGDQNWN